MQVKDIISFKVLSEAELTRAQYSLAEDGQSLSYKRNASGKPIIEKFNPLDDYYFTHTKGPVPQSLHVQFASLDGTDMRAVLDFSNKYGWLFGDLIDGDLQAFQKAQAEFKMLLDLYSSLRLRNDKGIRENTLRVLNYYKEEPGGFWTEEDDIKNYKTKASPRLAKWLLYEKVKIKLEGRDEPSSSFNYQTGDIKRVYAFGTLMTAIYWMLREDILDNRRIVKCQNDYCLKYIASEHSTRVFCTHNCYNAQNVRKSKMKSKQKRLSHPTGIWAKKSAKRHGTRARPGARRSRQSERL